MHRIRRVGCLPKEFNITDGKESKTEHDLARQLRHARTAQTFTEAETIELVALEQTELNTLIWDAYNADGETIVQLYVTACERMQDGMKLQSSYDEQLLEEVAW